MSRFEFVIIFCGTWVLMDVISWALGLGFDFQSVFAAVTIVPVCAWLMPDKKPDERHKEAG